MARAVLVEELWKQYRLGQREPYGALRDSVAGMVPKVRALARLVRDDRSRRASEGRRELFWALNGVSFEVAEGEVLGVVGRNGAGKSTLLKILSRITGPTRGRAELLGRVGSLLEVGTGFHPELTGRENVFLNGALLGMRRTEIRARLDEIVEFAGLERFLDTPVKRYSSGMYMRLAFSVAAHLEPEILLVDEVLAVGDIAFQEKCIGRMRDVAAGGRTVLFVSHNMAAVRRLCSRAIMLDAGTKVADGDVSFVLTRYVESVRGESYSSVKRAAHTVSQGEAWLRSVALRDPAAPGAVYWRQPIVVDLEVDVETSLRNVYFGVGISTLHGAGLLTVHSTRGRDEPLSLEPGCYHFSVAIENNLRPGTFTLSVGATDAGSSTSIFYVDEAMSFEVLGVSAGQEALPRHGSGLVNGYGEWSEPVRVADVITHAGGRDPVS